MSFEIFQNSYVMTLITFFVAYVVLYLLGIGYETKVEDGEEVKKMSYKYPLVIALIVWLVWYFYMYPPNKGSKSKISKTKPILQMDVVSEKSLPNYVPEVPINDQKMITDYWY